MRHWLAHWLGWNGGRLYFGEYDGWDWVTFVCDGCGAWERATRIGRAGCRT